MKVVLTFPNAVLLNPKVAVYEHESEALRVLTDAYMRAVHSGNTEWACVVQLLPDEMVL